MTENMAGRGEGLAGLVARERAWAKTLRGSNCNTEAREIERICDELAALEAAAPAGTAPRKVTSDCLDQLREMLDRKDLSGADLYALNEAITALATPTPSPQAPAEPTAEHNRLVASLCGCGTPYMSDCERCERIAAALAKVPRSGEQSSGLGRSKGEPFNLSQNAESAPSSVATQEPAGSGASENDLWLGLAKILRFEKGDDGDWFIPAEPQPLGPFFSILQAAVAFMRFIDATDKAMREEIEKLRAGSPRKVGEDGALKVGDDVWVRGVLLRIDVNHLLVEVYDCGDGYEILSRPKDARSSSVPVGEQKQEEGV